MQMDNKQETRSNWNCVIDELFEKNEKPLELGRYVSYWYHKSPRRMLHSLSYYKFAAKLIGSNKRVLDIGCNEGLGSWLIAKECGFCYGMDFDGEAIQTAQKNFKDPSIQFGCEDFLEAKPGNWDAVVNFDVIEHIYPEHAKHFLQNIVNNLKETGIAVIGTPSEISNQFASPITRKGHVNLYSPQRMEAEMREFFEFVFLFAANDEVVHTGYLPLAHYLIAVGCKPRKKSGS